MTFYFFLIKGNTIEIGEKLGLNSWINPLSPQPACYFGFKFF